MASVYIISEYGKLSKSYENLIFQNKDGVCKTIMLSQTNLIVLNSHVSLTGETIHLLSEKNIPVYIAEYGKAPNVLLNFGDSKNGFLRQKQYRLADDKKRSTAIARTIVTGKIKNQLAFIQRIKRTKTECEELSLPVARIKKILREIDRCHDKEKLRGLEGAVAREYFNLFDLNLNPDWAVFGKRSRNPPETNVNAVLSYLYSLLTFQVQNALESQGLDTMCSNLHEMSYGKNSLAYDLMEEFRTPICDRLCCSLFNHDVLKEKDFEKRDGGIFMTKDGCSKVINAFEEKMNDEIKTDDGCSSITYLQLIYEQSFLYKKFILNESEYIPFEMK